MTEYSLVTYCHDGADAAAGVIVDNGVVDLGGVLAGSAFGAVSMAAVLNAWPQAKTEIESAVRSWRQPARDPGVNWFALETVQLLAPVQFPGVLYCAGVNYRDHVIEMTGKPPPKGNNEPYLFLKTTRGTIIGPGETIQLPQFSSKVDWEAEIALVIGRRARNVAKDDALGHVAGLTILNDLSARDHMKRDDVPFVFDWLGQKCFDTAAPMGPWILPMDSIEDPYDLDIKLWVNDQLMQDSNSKELIFKFDDLIAYLSQHVTLYPGDVIATGTPAGCGHPKGLYLKHGDEVRITVDGLGTLTNPVVQL